MQRQARGGHEVWGNDTAKTVVPHHASQDITARTLRSILRDLGLTESDLNEL